MLAREAQDFCAAGIDLSWSGPFWDYGCHRRTGAGACQGHQVLCTDTARSLRFSKAGTGGTVWKQQNGWPAFHFIVIIQSVITCGLHWIRFLILGTRKVPTGFSQHWSLYLVNPTHTVHLFLQHACEEGGFYESKIEAKGHWSWNWQCCSPAFFTACCISLVKELRAELIPQIQDFSFIWVKAMSWFIHRLTLRLGPSAKSFLCRLVVALFAHPAGQSCAVPSAGHREHFGMQVKWLQVCLCLWIMLFSHTDDLAHRGFSIVLLCHFCNIFFC